MEYFKNLSRKDYIIKANRIIREEGFEAISIRRLAKEAGCSSANLYRYFSNLEELIYYAGLGELKGYILALNKFEKIWQNVWDRYVGVWYCCCMESFRNPTAYNLIFFNQYDFILSEAISEYYRMFPDEINESSTSFQRMLRTPDFLGRDFEMCKICIKENAISYEKAVQLNRIVCLLYKGYLKTIMDKKIVDDDEINKMVWNYVDECEIIVRALADDMCGYDTYKKVITRLDEM